MKLAQLVREHTGADVTVFYLDIRAPNDGWRERYPQLASWLEKFSRYPSVEATKPPG